MTQDTTPAKKSAQPGSIRKNVEDKKPRTGRRSIYDECVPVHCRKCNKYLATVIPKAEVLCHDCSTPNRNVWTAASAHGIVTEGSKKRTERRRAAA